MAKIRSPRNRTACSTACATWSAKTRTTPPACCASGSTRGSDPVWRTDAVRSARGMRQTEDLSGLRKSAIVLLSLGEQHAAELLRRLPDLAADMVRAEM